MSTSWVKDIGPHLIDDTHIVLEPRQFESLDAYESSIPTSPSPGRAYRRGSFVFFVEDDPDEPGWQNHRPRKVLLL